MTDLSALGEFGVIERFAGKLPAGRDVVVGLGDDGAVVRCGERDLILATDLLVEGRHFLREAIDPADLGYKALAVNASDIAAMGGVPDHALVSLALPADLDVDYLDRLSQGFAEACVRFGIGIAGGDTTRGDGIVINVALTGHLEAGTAPVTRAGAQSGDLVCVTNDLGDSDGGLRLTLAGRADTTSTEGRALLRAHTRPLPRLAEGLAAARHGASAMIDLSDGLLADLGHICAASGVGAEIDAESLPMSDALRAVAGELGYDPLESALAGGEDYELLMTVSPECVEGLQDAVEVAGSSLATIGRITSGDSVTVIGAVATRSGWDHFAGKGQDA
ncbi:MAG: thiamine-phosphate kinase [Coriobacteriales bacterium]|nr:thiamine-phosphate kinase [Coriobacteriales bacterium]